MNNGPPGPGSYKIKNKTNTGPQFSIAGKPPPEHDRGVPGPGTYKAGASLTKSSIIIGSGPKVAKDFSSLQSVPGPGTYKAKS